jgi:hypothetical protein
MITEERTDEECDATGDTQRMNAGLQKLFPENWDDNKTDKHNNKRHQKHH